MSLAAANEILMTVGFAIATAREDTGAMVGIISDSRLSNSGTALSDAGVKTYELGGRLGMVANRIFARTLLKLDTLADGTIDKRVYDLDPLADPSFEFMFPPDSKISDATVTKIRLELKHGAKRRILLEADTFAYNLKGKFINIINYNS